MAFKIRYDEDALADLEVQWQTYKRTSAIQLACPLRDACAGVLCRGCRPSKL